MYKKRLIEEKIRRASIFFKTILLVGARQVGKSTILRHLFPAVPIVTFDPLEDIGTARKDPSFSLESTQPLVF